MEKNYMHNMPYNDGWKQKKGPLNFKMCNDYLFRAFLQRDEVSLKNLIADFLKVDFSAIKDVIVTNPIVLGENIDEKEIHLDVQAVVAYADNGEDPSSERTFDFEMQTVRHEGWIERSLYYACRNFADLSHGSNYENATGIWQVSFCDFCLFADRPAFYSCFKLVDVAGSPKLYTDKFTISNIDLTHINLASKTPNASGLVKWAKLFKAETWEELHMLAQEDKKIEQAVSSAWQLTEDERIRDQMWHREEGERIWNATIRSRDEYKRKYEESEETIKDLKADIDDLRQAMLDLQSKYDALLKEKK